MVVEPAAKRPLLPVAGVGVAFAVGVGGAVVVTAMREFAGMTLWQRTGVVALGVGMIALAMVWRSRDRWSVATYLLTQLLAGSTLTLVSRGHGALALLPVLAQSVLAMPSSGVSVVVGYTMLVTVLAHRLRAASWSAAVGMSAGHLAGALFVAAFTAIYMLERRARAKNEELLRALEAAHQRQRDFALQGEELATARERARIARDVHDILGHSLTAVQAQLAGALAVQARDPARSASLVESALALTSDGLADIRGSVAALRPDGGRSLVEELRRLVAAAAASGVAVTLLLDGAPYEPPAMMSLAVCRMVQECLTNGRRHGGATAMRVTIGYREHELSVCIDDDGVGADLIVPGGGLTGIHERVTMLGGELVVDSQRDTGLRIAARLPMDPARPRV